MNPEINFERTWTWVNKKKWGAGPWESEADKVQFKDPETGLPCLIVRHSRDGHLCGYVGVAEGHPLYGVDYDDVPLEVHGGLSFSSFCSKEEKEHGICHVPGPGEPDKVWWLGFDMRHALDIAPGFESREMARFGDLVLLPGAEYRTIEYVVNECRALARQIANYTEPI